MRYIIFIVSISILDLFSKYVIKNKVPVNTKIEILKDKLYIWHIKNKGTEVHLYLQSLYHKKSLFKTFF